MRSTAPEVKPAPVTADRLSPHALWTALRPRQWAKNAALLTAPLFARKLTDPWSLVHVLLATGVFCCLASAVYLLNDVADREADRHHPEKAQRPIAAGTMSVPFALTVASALLGLGLAGATTLGTGFVGICAAYLCLQVLYTTVLKHVVVLDVFAIAAGFVLRFFAGAEAIAVPVSNWLYLCALLLSLFLALVKRRAELTTLQESAARHRAILAEYSVELLDQLVTMVAACTVLAYSLYTLAPDTIEKFGTDRLKFTIPSVLFGLSRYLYLVHRYGAGGQPERVLLSDRATQLNLVGFVALVAWALYAKDISWGR